MSFFIAKLPSVIHVRNVIDMEYILGKAAIVYVNYPDFLSNVEIDQGTQVKPQY